MARPPRPCDLCCFRYWESRSYGEYSRNSHALQNSKTPRSESNAEEPPETVPANFAAKATPYLI